MSLKFNFQVDQYYESGEVKKSDVKKIKNYLKSESMPADCDEMIAAYIICCHGDLLKAKYLASADIKGRKHLPELFKKRVFDDDLFKQWNVVELARAPERTVDGCGVIILRFRNSSASDFNMDLTSKLVLMAIDSIMYDGPFKGLLLLLDMGNMSLRHFMKLHVSLIRRIMKYAAEGLINIVKKVHMVNEGFAVEKLYQLLKLICKPHVFELFLCHPSNMSWVEFYENHIPRSHLPLDYGGELESMEVLNKHLLTKLEEMDTFFEEEEKYRQKYEQTDKY